ncbi:Beta-N-acetylhexosaminidase precursor [uncultured Flavonifractor sp.]|nr:Beta-N-acetylhexosaminidase precursor [uncultured Flavonifractor sp.]
MKKAVRKGASKAVALVLSLAMIFGMAPMVSASAGNTADVQDNFDRIVHLDMGRKYFTPDWIKSLIDEMAKLGYNQLELDFGNSETGQFRFALSDMSVTYTYTEQTMVPVDNTDAQEEPAAPVETGEPVEEQPAAPVQTEEPVDEEQTAETVMPLQEEPAAPAETTEPTAPVTDEVLEQAEESGTANGVLEYNYLDVPTTNTVYLNAALPADDKYITEAEMEGIIDHAKDKGIEIVPLLNSPGHFGAVLDGVQDENDDPVNFSYNNSNSLDITNGEAVAFGQAVVLKYAQWFWNKGCCTFNIGADEFYTEGGSFGGLTQETYRLFADYVNGLYDGLEEIGYTTIRAFNDGFYYTKKQYVEFRPFEICYWSSGYSGYDYATAQTIQDRGHSLINTHGNYYYIVGGGSPMMKGELAASSFSATEFMGGHIENPSGAMFCIWSDNPLGASEHEVWTDLFDDPAYLLDFTTGLKGTVTKTDEKTGVQVTANGLTRLTVTEATLEESSYKQYVAYDMEPATDTGAYTKEAEVTIPLGTLKDYDASRLTGFVVNSDGTIQEIGGTKSGDSYTFTMPHFSVGGVALKEAYYTMPDGYKGSVEQKTATGDTYYEKVSGASGIVPGEQYLIVGKYSGYREDYYYAMTADGGVQQVVPKDGRIEDSYDSNLWTFESSNGSYKLKDSSGTYAYPTASGEWYGWSYSLEIGKITGEDVTVSGNDTVTIGRKVQSGRSNTDSYIVLSTRWGSVNGFGAGNEGDDLTLYKKVSIPGGTYYTVGKDGMNRLISEVPTTNNGVYTEASWDPFENALQAAQAELASVQDSYDSQTDAEQAQDALNQAAEALYVAWRALENDPDYVPEPDWTPRLRYYIANDHNVVNVQGENEVQAVATTSGKPIAEMVDEWITRSASGREAMYWKTYVQSNPKQAGNGSEDLTDEGKNIGTQAVSLKYDEKNWLYESTDGKWTVLSQDDQLTVYYVEKTTVSREITVFTSDWGSDPYDSANNWIFTLPNGAFSVSFQTVYVDTGYVSPENLKNTTQFTGTDTQYSVIEILNSSEYEVVNVTLLKDKFSGSSASNFRLPTFPQPDMEKEHSIYNKDGSVQAIPKVRRDEDKTAWLVRIYVKPVEKENTLTIRYVDETTGSDVEIHTGSINAYKELTYNDAVTGYTTFGNLTAAQLRAMTADEMNASYILSPTGDGTGSVKQYFNTDLKDIPAIDAKYKSGIYEYTGAAISDDGRTLTFYYKADTAVSSYVVDFGLSVNVPVTDLVNNPGDVIDVTVGTARYGTVTVSATNSTITYTPTAILKGTDSVQVTISYGTSSITAMLYFVPASTVYYEAEGRDFVEFQNGSSNMNWTAEGTSGNRTQAAEKLGEKENNYGSDPAYNSKELTWSNENAQKVTVSEAAFGESGKWPTATFTFTGTGADIISQTDVKAGVILVDVKQGTEYIKSYIVNNYYGYTYSDTGWTVSKDRNGNGIDSIYQVPVIAIRDLDHGTYTVTITVAYDGLFDVASQGSFDFYLDAIRVYNPLESSSVYAVDGESAPIFKVLHNLVTKFGDTGTLVDGLEDAKLDQFKTVGPNNEIYLTSGQSVTVDLEESVSGKNAQIAARLIDGKSATLNIDDKTVTVNSTVDQYYTITGGVNGNEVTITNNGQGTVALTILKLTGGSN